MKWTPEDLSESLRALQEAGLSPIIVGGQAINIWAVQYLPGFPELEEFKPFASEDLDLFGSRLEVRLCHQVLGGKAVYARDFDPSPNAGVLLVPYGDQQLRIDVLSSVFGVNDSEVARMAIPFQGVGILSNMNVSVLHPVLCLEGKLAALKNLPQQNRQDLKHSRMSVLIVNCFIRETIDQTRAGLSLLNRILDRAIQETGLWAWYRHQICIEKSIPQDAIAAHPDPRWQRFLEINFSRFQQKIQERRDRYQQLMATIHRETPEQEQP